jgi:hypothetical protein
MWGLIALAIVLAGLTVWWLLQPVPPALPSRPVARASNDIRPISEAPVAPARQPAAEQVSPTVGMLRLVDAVTEQPIAASAVRIQGQDGERRLTTDEHGQIAAEGLAPSWLHVVGYFSAWVETGTSVVAMQPARTVPGRIEGWNGSYDTFVVFPDPHQKDARGRGYDGISVDGAGRFVFGPRFPGPHSFGVTSFGKPPTDLATTEWTPDQPEIVLRVPPSVVGESTLVHVRIHVDKEVREDIPRRVQEITAAGLEAMPKLGRSPVYLLSATGEQLRLGVHDLEVAEGELSLEVPSGFYEPILEFHGLVARGGVQACRGSEVTLDLHVGSVASVDVELVGWPNGEPTEVSLALVSDLSGAKVSWLFTHDQRGGRARRIGSRLVPAGDVVVWCLNQDVDMAARPQRVRLAPGDKVGLVVELVPGGFLRVNCGDFVGRLRRLVVVEPASGLRQQLEIPRTQSDTAVFLPRGPWVLEAWLDDGTVLRRDVEVGAGVTRYRLER